MIQHLVEHGCPDITSRLDLSRCAPNPHSNGGFGEVYQGSLRNKNNVALKCIKISVDGEDKESEKALKVSVPVFKPSNT